MNGVGTGMTPGIMRPVHPLIQLVLRQVRPITGFVAAEAGLALQASRALLAGNATFRVTRALP